MREKSCNYETYFCKNYFGCKIIGMGPTRYCAPNDQEYDQCCDITFDQPCARIDEKGEPLCPDTEEGNRCPKAKLEFLE
jgi:hypothetical protein